MYLDDSALAATALQPALSANTDLPRSRHLQAPIEAIGLPDPSVRAVFLDLLKLADRALPFDLWMITRVDGNDWTVIESLGNRTYSVPSGQVFCWTDSICSRMVEGRGPVYAADVEAHPAYSTAPIRVQAQIGAYFGVPIRRSDGTLFGTLCAISPGAMAAPELGSEQSDVLSTVIRAFAMMVELQQRFDAVDRRLAIGRPLDQTDPVTGLPNHTGFLGLLRREQTRIEHLLGDACIHGIRLDLYRVTHDQEGPVTADRLVLSASEALQSMLRPGDALARTAEDVFSVLRHGVRSDEADADADELQGRLIAEAFRVHVGSCGYKVAGSFLRAWRVALDLAMQSK
jgi:GGDEF domain-containing protein